MKIFRILLINLAVFSGTIVSIEVSLNIARYLKHGIKNSQPGSSEEFQTGKIIPTGWEQFFHSVGNSHQKSEFIQNINTSKLIHDNLSVTEVFKSRCLYF